MYQFARHDSNFGGWVVWILVLVAVSLSTSSSVAAERLAERSDAGVIVVVGDASLERTMELSRESDAVIYVQLAGANDVAPAREKAYRAELYGSRVFIEQGDTSHLNIADNIADVVYADHDGVNLPKEEALRVLRPEGVARLTVGEFTKPFPHGVDDWSHPYHGPDNNPQSKDKIAKGPYLTHFLARPYYAPLPQLAVASAGRMFKAYGHIAFKPREEPLLNSLVAYNGYNGAMLWRRKITPGLMVHRNTLIATPELVYFADENSCQVIDAATGELKDEIAPPKELTGGTFWKWMALDGDVLYALIGEDEPRDPVIKQNRDKHGWPWDPLSPGFNREKNEWGFGRTLVAIDPKSKKVLWHYKEEAPIDARSISMAGGRIFLMRFGVYIACVDANTGKPIWRKTPKNDPGLFETIGADLNRQDWRTNWRTATYTKCNTKAVYLAGTMFEKLIALNAETGSMLWQDDYSNYQLVLRDDAVYAISGQIDEHVSKKIDPLSGENLGELAMHRRGCARPTGAADALFFRADGGSVRFDCDRNERQWVSPMRAQCHDGVTIANGLLYWWPSTCDCQLTLYGMTCLGPAGDFDFYANATVADRLERGTSLPAAASTGGASLESAADWPTYRANNEGRATSQAEVPVHSQVAWKTPSKSGSTPTAPVVVDGRAFIGDSDGVVRAIDVESGEKNWTFFTGGAIRMPPTVWNERVFVGSGDGWVYSLDAASGELIWRFRAAPIERTIPVYGSLLSTWPVASGVLVDDGVAYFAAGIVNYDGTYVYALDAETGEIKWQNNTSGHLDRDARTGVSVQGQMLLRDGKLYLAGGTSVSPAIYDVETGACLNDPAQLKECYSIFPRGAELSIFGDHVFACGQPLYKDPDSMVHDPSAIDKVFLSSVDGRDMFWADNNYLICSKPINTERLNAALAKRERNWMIPSWGELKFRDEPIWRHECPNSRAVAYCANAVVIAADSAISAVSIEDGSELWEHPLPSEPVVWGMAVDRAGRAVVSLRDGTVVCVATAE